MTKKILIIEDQTRSISDEKIAEFHDCVKNIKINDEGVDILLSNEPVRIMLDTSHRVSATQMAALISRLQEIGVEVVLQDEQRVGKTIVIDNLSGIDHHLNEMLVDDIKHLEKKTECRQHTFKGEGANIRKMRR